MSRLKQSRTQYWNQQVIDRVADQSDIETSELERYFERREIHDFCARSEKPNLYLLGAKVTLGTVPIMAAYVTETPELALGTLAVLLYPHWVDKKIVKWFNRPIKDEMLELLDLRKAEEDRIQEISEVVALIDSPSTGLFDLIPD